MGTLLLVLSLLFPNIESDFECLTEAVYYEAGNQSLSGMLDVGQVISNRVDHSRWPDSFCGVVREKDQFSYYWDGIPETMPRKDNSIERSAVSYAKIISLVILTLPINDSTDGSLYYHSGSMPKGWNHRVIAYTKTSGDHTLYTDAD